MFDSNFIKFMFTKRDTPVEVIGIVLLTAIGTSGYFVTALVVYFTIKYFNNQMVKYLINKSELDSISAPR